MSINLVYLAAELTRIIVPLIIVLGIFSNAFNIFLLTRPALMPHPCSLYFLAMAITNLFYSSFLLIFNLLVDGYHLDVTRSSKFLCKLTSYFLNLCPTLSIYFLVLASIDRYWVSSADPRRRSRSNIPRARWKIGALVGVFGIFFIGAIVSFDLSPAPLHSCLMQPNELFNRIFLILVILIYVILAPSLIILFGFLTIWNTKQIRAKLICSCRSRRTEGQLTRMLVLQVGTHLFLTLPFCIVFFMMILPLDVRWTAAFTFTYTVSKIPFYFTATTAFFLYVLSARMYRNECRRLYRRIRGILVRHRNTSRVTPIAFSRTDE